MQLLEYQAKTLLSKAEAMIPNGFVVRPEDTIGELPFPFPAVVKSQVPVGGRGKLGGVKLVHTQKDLQKARRDIEQLEIKGHVPSAVLIEQALDIDREVYVSLRVNRDQRRTEWVVSREGGVDIESHHNSVTVMPYSQENTHEQIASLLKISAPDFADLAAMLERCFFDNDLLLLEINPLVITKQGSLVCADAKIAVDDNAQFRHPDFSWPATQAIKPLGGVASILREAAELGYDLSEIKHREFERGVSVDTSTENSEVLAAQAWLERRLAQDSGHYIGVIANGAGMAMSTMDTIYAAGAAPANFLDIGGGTGEDVFVKNLREITELPGVTSIIVNIFAGITRCDDIARGIIAAKKQIPNLAPLFIRLEGTNRDEAAELLRQAGVELQPDLKACIELALQADGRPQTEDIGKSQESQRPEKTVASSELDTTSAIHLQPEPALLRTQGGPGAKPWSGSMYTASEHILASQPVIVQGITGHHGAFHTKQMLASGTNIVAGVTPGKAGETVHGLPVYNTVKEAFRQHSATTSVLFVPAQFAKNAMLEAIDAGVKLIVCITEGIPVHDMLAVHEKAAQKDVTVVGPNCPGFIVPGSHKLGIIASHITRPGNTTIISRSGTLTYELADALSKKGVGQRLILGIGGDPVQGMTFVEALKLAENDPKTKQIVLVGEIGGEGENLAADFVAKHITKPVHGLVVGHSLPAGQTFGHAGAIVGSKGESAADKTAYMSLRGIHMSTTLDELISLLS